MIKMAADYGKRGLVGATLAAARESMSRLNFHEPSEAMTTVLRLMLICSLGALGLGEAEHF